MDDIGAASKRYEVYAKPLRLPGRMSQIGDILFLKYLPPLRAWGPYRELTAQEWRRILEILRTSRARMTVGITAAWVTWSGDLIPFPERFPGEAQVIRDGVNGGLIEVANHGLTHCVLERHAFRPRLFTGNRREHREFWDRIPEARQREHLERAQGILQGWLGTSVVTFVPPGNVFGDATIRAARAAGLRILSCETASRELDGLRILGNERVRAFHDRDLVQDGIERLGLIIDEERARGRDIVFVRQLAGGS
jgi:peptidoglycan/xylan/chitin deacetylase (PgdA/CDA1 family)